MIKYVLREDVKDVMRKNLKNKVDKLDFDALLALSKMFDDTKDEIAIMKKCIELLFARKETYYSTLLLGMHECLREQENNVSNSESEQNNDQSGIIWPKSVAPFELVIIPINTRKSKDVHDKAEDLYKNFLRNGCDVILDDREDVRPGAKFNEWELIGIPHRIVISEKGLARNVIEYRARDLMNTLELSAEEALRMIL